MAKAPIRSIVFLWLGWAILMLGFQALVLARIDLVRPDNAVTWSAAETTEPRNQSDLSHLDSFIASHVAWDSKYYIAIALNGYGDPDLPVVGPASTPNTPQTASRAAHPDWPSVSSAFLPGYPVAMRILAWPLQAAGLDSVSAAALAGVAVSLLGALAAMLAAADLARGQGADEGGLRAAFFLAIWPGSVFLAQVYSEGLFLGLSFGALALLRREQWLWAAAFAVASVWTRATGVLLVIPFAWMWFGHRTGSRLVKAVCVAAPVLAWLAWRFTLGGSFAFVEAHYFGRGMLWLGPSWDDWRAAADSVLEGDPQAWAYRLMEFIAVAVGLVTTGLLWRRDKALATYGAAVIVAAATSGASLGMLRYVLSVPALFLVPASLGRVALFDRLWTLACVLGLALLAITFSFGFWTG